MDAVIGILNLLTPMIVWAIRAFLKDYETREKALRNYYDFLASIDKKAATKAANYMAAEEALIKLQLHIREKELSEPAREQVAIAKANYSVPEIVVVDTEVKTHGKYLTELGSAKGLVVHFTAGRFEKGSESAINTLIDVASRGFGCLVMDTAGIIYRAKNQDLSQIAWHAGESSWQGKSGISRYCMGLEICNAGKLDADGKTWFGVQIPEKERRQIATKRLNQEAGTYHKFTDLQEAALVNFCLWQLDVNPEFSIDWIVGHDEIAPGRKDDPGGSLSMTMKDFRAMIKKLSEA